VSRIVEKDDDDPNQRSLARWIHWLEEFIDIESGGHEVPINAALLSDILCRAHFSIGSYREMWWNAEMKVRDQGDEK